MNKPTKAEISRVMAALARKRKPDQCKGGRPKLGGPRCACGNHTEEYAARWNLQCSKQEETKMENVEQGSKTFELECARAKAEQAIPDDEAPIVIAGAHCDYSARLSCREHWFRMVWRNNAWAYISARLVPVGVRSSERHQTTKGEVWVGEIIAGHDRGKPVTGIGLIVKEPVNDSRIVWLNFSRRRDGQLSVTLPDLSTLLLPDPRKNDR